MRTHFYHHASTHDWLCDRRVVEKGLCHRSLSCWRWSLAFWRSVLRLRERVPQKQRLRHIKSRPLVTRNHVTLCDSFTLSHTDWYTRGRNTQSRWRHNRRRTDEFLQGTRATLELLKKKRAPPPRFEPNCYVRFLFLSQTMVIGPCRRTQGAAWCASEASAVSCPSHQDFF